MDLKNVALFPATEHASTQVLRKSFSDRCPLRYPRARPKRCPCYLNACCSLEDENICGARTCHGSSFLCPRSRVQYFCTLKQWKFTTEMFNWLLNTLINSGIISKSDGWLQNIQFILTIRRKNSWTPEEKRTDKCWNELAYLSEVWCTRDIELWTWKLPKCVL